MQYEKLILTKDMKIKKVEFVLEGRKVPLSEIRQKTLRMHAPYMREYTDAYYNEMNRENIVTRLKELNEYNDREDLTTDNLRSKLIRIERNRHLMIWHDNSTVANHGFLVCLVSVMYDHAIFLTNEEFKRKTGKTVEVQTVVEKPEVHFIARCKSSEEEQIAYSETRLSCIKEIADNFTTPDGHQVVDTLRFFHGDSPAREFECGQQKGGHYYCSNCGCHAFRVDEIHHAISCPEVSLQDRVNAIMEGAVSKTNTLQLKLKPLKNLSRDDLERELASRQIYDGNTKQDLQKLLDQEMHGIQRVPALLVNCPKKKLTEIGLAKYEILPTEPLHDVGHHIENVITEFPHHLKESEKKVFDECTEMCLGNKESKRGVDYRAAVIKTTSYLSQTDSVSAKALQVLETLTEIQRILYSQEKDRCPQTILRYYNQAWYHAILLKEFIQKPKKLTYRKMFGVYFHDLTAHGGLMLRIVSGQTANTEEEERIFNHIKKITKHTSNYSTGQIIPNLLLRLQAEKEMGSREDVQKQQSFISILSKSLPPKKNTTIPIAVIKKHQQQWQAHLEHISDFLLPGEGVWWHRHGDYIEFHDVSGSPSSNESGPELHHFRSSSLKDEEEYLQLCWQKCLEKQIIIPINVIRITVLPQEKVKYVQTCFLGDPSDNSLITENDEIADTMTVNKDYDKFQCFEDNEEEEEDEQVIAMFPAADEVTNIDTECGQQSVVNECNTTATTSTGDNNAITNNFVPFNSKEQQETTPKCISFMEHTSRSLTEGYKMETKHGKALSVVLGVTDVVKKFDKKHYELKKCSNDRRKKRLEEDYKGILAKVQVKVLAENTAAKKSLQQWEHEYILSNNLTTPSYDEMKANPIASLLLQKIKCSDALLTEWKIDFS